MAEPIRYTMDDLDAALRAIMGEQLFDVLRKSARTSRPHMMDAAARKCWVDQRPEDQHTTVLRAAIRHLDRTGVIMPEDVR